MKTTKTTLVLKYSPMGFLALAAPTEDGVFWLSGYNYGVSRAVHRAGQQVTVQYEPADQFAYEVDNGEVKKGY